MVQRYEVLKEEKLAHMLEELTQDELETLSRGLERASYLILEKEEDFGEKVDQEVLDTWVGRYLDRYQKRSGEWRILERVCVHEGTHSGPVTPMAIDAARFYQGNFDRMLPA